MNTAELASASAETWNKKNQPSEIERFEETPSGPSAWFQRLPSAAADMFKRRGNTLWVSVAVVSALGLVWYFYNRAQKAD